MKNISWAKLKSGTDIRGVALEEEDTTVNLTEEVAKTIGQSFTAWLTRNKNKQKENLTVAIGMDSRITGEKLKDSLTEGITNCGIDVYHCGLASTPAMFMSTILSNHKYDGAVMITASHLPYNRNGFKFFTAEGGLEGKNIKEILSIAEGKEFSSSKTPGEIEKINLLDDYSQYIVNKIRTEVTSKIDKTKPLKGFKIIVDAGNGAGGFFVDKILKPLGADTKGSQFLKPDGYFPNHIPNPENEEAMASIKKAVVENNADLGIIFDTDVDRAAVVAGSGQIINRNKLIALASTIVLEEYPGATIVTDSVTSKGLTTFIEEKLGGRHHRFKRGYKNVINEAIRLNKEGEETPLAIETSGHAAFKENHFLDDGAYLIAKILVKMANLKTTNNSISDLIADLQEPEISKEYRMTINLDEFQDYGQRVLKKLKSYVDQIANWEVAPKNYEGVRINCGKNDWFLLRMSLHDPVFVLNLECENKANLNTIKTKLKNFLEEFKHVDSTPLLD